MKNNKLNKKILFSTMGALAIAGSVIAIAASCNNSGSSAADVKGKFEAKNSGSYATQMSDLAGGTITLASAWGDAASIYAKDNRDDIIVVGATTAIANDGVQVRNTLKKGDIKALQILFTEAIKKAKENEKALKANPNAENKELTIDVGGKSKSVFSVYNHDGYAQLVDENAEITVNPQGDKRKLYSKSPEEGSEYFEISSDNKVTKKTGSKKLKVQFIPSGDPTNVQKAVSKISEYFNTMGLDNFEITVSTSYDQAANSLNNGLLDVAFLPVDTWATKAQNTNFILQAGRSVQIIDPYVSLDQTFTPAFTSEKLLVDAANGYRTFSKGANGKVQLYIQGTGNPTTVSEGYPEALKTVVDKLATAANGDTNNLKTVGFYRAYIYARKDSEIAKMIQEAMKKQGENWKLNWNDVKGLIKFGYTSKTSSASYTFPEEWFKKHFDGFTSFEREKN
ncbi:PhnD/SsuA/transferrin family substrate-binding protein [Ureaplasma sp. ES3154-GEN]|uniref:Vmc-like lipoprotein signal peptide domain-containing protein n=1 Tax=Ureaplasma sp. ES3154-GEN TaxID=2984844 RepID=UPI0021E91F47|nr:PhnD/SsuA/transferrin family substrate-binding protein [Ureaplasma sp. ES3154-GEN]MCV3743369.1 PhnD/SsuA/transferrin family substrate-binding protein [Ureaplasma sp. ES3154-GEN]